jgi:hypothetical protein
MGIAESVIDKLAQSTWLTAVLLALPFVFASAASGAEPAGSAGPPVPSPAAAALELITLTPADARARLLQPNTFEARSDWNYTPRERSGIPYKEMNPAQRQAANALLRTALSAPGLDKVHAIMALEIALREMETFSSRRDPENYAVAIFGTPAAQGAAWGFRLEGHHISLHFTLQNEAFISTLPQFLGANPALVPQDSKGGPKKNTRVLGELEDLARALLSALDPKARAVAVFDTRTYGDIVTRNARSLDPLAPVGIRFGELPSAEQASLLRLISAFASHLRPELSRERLERVRAGGLDTIRFGWAGPLERGKPFYYRIQGSKFLIELDNSGGNHIHSVWRDFAGDWGRDVLGEHYTGSGKAHGHSAD